MNEYDVKKFALILAIQAEIEGMKIFNKEQLSNGLAPGYGDKQFVEKAEELRILANTHNEQL